MQELYGDLGGANPLVESRVLDTEDMHEFIQFGPALFIQKTRTQQPNMLRPEQTLFQDEINKIFRFFISSVAIVTSKFGGGTGAVWEGTPPTYYSRMHWPRLHATLRSGETLQRGLAASNHNDASGHIPKFWVNLKQLSMKQVLHAAKAKRAERHTAASSNDTFYAPGVRTTMDAGGDCHRQPIPVVSRTQLDTILAADVCFVVQANATHRKLECTQSGQHNKTTLHLGTTYIGGMTPSQYATYMKPKKIMRPCVHNSSPQHQLHAPTSQSGTTITHSWNRSTLQFDAVPVRDELSLSRRVRISPIWNMLARLGTHAKGKGLYPKRVWRETVQRRFANPKWQAASATVSDSAMWDAQWVFKNTDDRCKDEGYGSIAQKNWYNNPHKGKLCQDMSKQFLLDRPNCLKGLANSFQLCQIDKLKDFCRVIQETRAEIRQVNAWANAYTKTRAKLYLPSRFLRQDGIFGWSAIVETYNTISPDVVTSASCAGVQKFFSNAGTVRLEECPSDYMFMISRFVEQVRSIVALFVRIVVLMIQVGLDLVMYLLSVLAGDDDMQKNQLRNLLMTLKELFSELQVFLKMMYGMMWDLVTSSDGVFKSIQELLTKLCNFAKQIVLAVVGAVRDIFAFISRIPGVGGSLSSVINSLNNFLESVLGWNCDLLEDQDDADINSEKLHASSCWLEQAGFVMPSDLLGGKVSEYTCGPTSYCLKDTLSVDPSILCMKCGMKDLTAINTLTMGYTCDLATKQCVCGEKMMDATPCLNSGECALTNAICAVKVNLFTGAVSSELCSTSIGVSFCAMASISEATGKCTTFFNDVVETTPTCRSATLDYEASEISYKEALCVGYAASIASARTSIPVSRTFVFPCTDIASANTRAQVDVGCLQLVGDVSVQSSRMSVLTYNTRKLFALDGNNRRTLLSFENTTTSHNATRGASGHRQSPRGGGSGPPEESLLLQFAMQSISRVSQIPGTCGRVLRTCLLEASDSPMLHMYQNIYHQRDCFSCMQTWWFFNYTMHNTAYLPGSRAYADVDFIDARNIIVNLVTSPFLLPGILSRTPHACYRLMRDWLVDDEVLDKLVVMIRTPIKYADMLLYKVLTGLTLGPPRSSSYPSSQEASPHADTPVDLALLALHMAGQHGGTPADTTMRSTQAGTKPPRATVSQTLPAQSGRGAQRGLLQTQTPYFDSAQLEAVEDSIAFLQATLLDELMLLRTQTYGTVFEASNDMSCVISAGILQDEIVISFANVLRKDGWTIKPQCTKQQILDFSQLPAECPLVSAPLLRVYANTVVIAEYYAYMLNSGCLSNMSVSCLRPSLFTGKGVLEVLPRISALNESRQDTYNATTNLDNEQDVISHTLLSVFYFVTDIVSFDRSEILNMIYTFISMDALYDDVLYQDMLVRNEFTIGRLIRDLFDCNLRDTITCHKKKLPLLPVFTAVLLTIFVVTVFLPIPTVVIVLLWTFGSVYGTAYLAYNFSPVCSPRIPTCLGSGLFELSGQLLPGSLSVPKSLYNHQLCHTNLTLKTDAGSVPKDFTCGKTCMEAPYKMDNILTVLIAVESIFQNGDATIARYLLVEYGFIASYDTQQHYLDVITLTGRQVRENNNDYVAGLYVCIAFNSYKAVGFLLILFFLVPAALNVIISTISYMIVLIVKYTLMTYNTDIYDNMY